jgi:hypothetical protein
MMAKKNKIFVYLIIITIAFFIGYMFYNNSGRSSVATVKLVDDYGRTLYTSDLKTDDSMQLQSVRGLPHRNRLSDDFVHAMNNTNATGMYITIKLKNDGNVPINVTLDKALLVGGFK